ncbi:MAG: hypothetical protein ACK4FU_01265 [Fervidobacterium gondwanense]
MSFTRIAWCVLTYILLQTVLLFPLDFVLFGHKDAVWELQTDGNLIYSVSADGTLKVWNKELVLLNTVTTHNSWARCVALSDKYIAVGGYKPDNVIRVYDKSNLKSLYTLKGHTSSVFTLFFYKDYLFSGGSDNSILVWKDFKLFKRLKYHDAWVRKVIVFGNFLVSGDENGRVVFSNITDFSLARMFELGSMVNEMSIIENSLIVGTSGGSVYEFQIVGKDVKYRKVLSLDSSVEAIDSYGDNLYISQLGRVLIFEKKAGFVEMIRKVSVSPSEIGTLKAVGTTIFAGNRQGEIYSYSIAGEYKAKSPRHFFSSAKLIKSYKNNELIVARENGNVESYSIQSGLIKWSYNLGTPARFVAEAKDEIVVGSGSGKLFFLKGGKLTASIVTEDALISFLKLKDNLFYVGSLGKLYLLEKTDKWSIRTVLKLEEEWVTALANKGNVIYIGTNIGNVYTYDMKTGKVSKIYKYPSCIVSIWIVNNSLYAFFFDGKYAVFDGKGWQLKNSEISPLYNVFFSGKDFILAGNGIKIKDKLLSFEAPVLDVVADKNVINILYAVLSNGVVVELTNYIPSRKFSSDIGKISTIYADDIIACGHEDGKVSVWKYVSGKLELFMVLDDHADSVRKVVRYKDTVISASNDRTIKVWDLKTGRLKRTLIGHTGYVWSLFIVGDTLISGGWDGKVLFWDLRDYSLKAAYDIKYSVTDIWSYSSSSAYVSTLEGYVVSVGSNRIFSLKISPQTLWSIEGVVDKNGKAKIYTAGWDGRVFVLDNRLREVKSFKGHNSTIFKIIFYDGKIITAGSDNLLKVWDENYNNIGTYSDFRQSVLSIALSKSLGLIITTDGKNILITGVKSIINF